MSKQEGGPAFPVANGMPWGGMTLRDYFAAKALGACRPWEQITPKELAKYAYRVADAMIKAGNPIDRKAE